MSTYTVHNCKNCGIDHEWQFNFPTLQELWVIKEVTRTTDPKTRKITYPGMGGGEFMQGLAAFEPAAWAALLVVLHKRDGIKVPYKSLDLDIERMEVDGTSILDAMMAAAPVEDEAGDEAGDEDEGADAPDPMPRSGQTPRAA